MVLVNREVLGVQPVHLSPKRVARKDMQNSWADGSLGLQQKEQKKKDFPLRGIKNT